MSIELIYKTVLDCAFEVHNELGIGLLESSYKTCLAYELRQRGLNIEVEKSIPIIYKGIDINCGYRADIIVENKIIIELKSIDKLNDIHLSQIITYMKLSKIKLGLLVNFNERYLKNGIKRVVV